MTMHDSFEALDKVLDKAATDDRAKREEAKNRDAKAYLDSLSTAKDWTPPDTWMPWGANRSPLGSTDGAAHDAAVQAAPGGVASATDPWNAGRYAKGSEPLTERQFQDQALARHDLAVRQLAQSADRTPIGPNKVSAALERTLKRLDTLETVVAIYGAALVSLSKTGRPADRIFARKVVETVNKLIRDAGH